MNEVIKVIKNHRSIRNYLDKQVSEEIINILIEVAQSAPSSINGQHTSVIVIRDKEKKAKIAELAGGQPWIGTAPVFFTFVGDFYKAKIAAEKVGKNLIIPESVEGILVMAVDIGLAMQNVITAAESLGLGIVPIGGIRNNPDEMIKILNLPEYTYPIVGLAIGYPADCSEKKPRMPKEAFRHDEIYDKEKLPKLIDEYDDILRDYLKRIGRAEEINWSEQTMKFYQYNYFPKVYPTMKMQRFNNDK
ncbi:MAG: NADPH-dependent oxidoreductase [Clostridium sp.]|nr:NADPH-dependent oxidoreductase [Clostridium sp.]